MRGEKLVGFELEVDGGWEHFVMTEEAVRLVLGLGKEAPLDPVTAVRGDERITTRIREAMDAIHVACDEADAAAGDAELPYYIGTSQVKK